MQFEYNYSLIALRRMRLPTNHIALPTTTLIPYVIHSNFGTIVNLVAPIQTSSSGTFIVWLMIDIYLF